MTTVYTHDAAARYLEGGRNRTSRPIANNTRVEARGDDIAIALHGTDVVTFHPDGSVTLNSGGWLTITTKARMNDYLGNRGRVYSDRGIWFFHPLTRGWGSLNDEAKIRYFDGIRIAADGTVLNPEPEAKQERLMRAEEAMRKRIRKFVDGYMKALAEGMPIPSGGDCWDCSMVTDDGKSMGDLKSDQINGHLFSHMTDDYYVPTLIWNAMRDRGYRDVAITMGLYLDVDAYNSGTMRVRREWGSTTEPDKHTLKEVRQTLSKYLSKRLLKGRAH